MTMAGDWLNLCWLICMAHKHSPLWHLLCKNSNTILINIIYHVTSAGICFFVFYIANTVKTLGHSVLSFTCMLFCGRQTGKKNLVWMSLPGRAHWGFDYECVTVHACVYFGEITMGDCVFTLHGKNHSVDCVENQWHVSFSAWLCRAPEAVHVVHMVALWLNIKSPFSVPDTCSCSHLISLLSSTSPSSITISRVLLCSSLFSLFCWQRLNVTPSAMACCCVCVYKGRMFYQRCSGHGLWLGLGWLHHPLGRHTHFKKKKKTREKSIYMSIWIYTRWIFFIWTLGGKKYVSI